MIFSSLLPKTILNAKRQWISITRIYCGRAPRSDIIKTGDEWYKQVNYPSTGKGAVAVGEEKLIQSDDEHKASRGEISKIPVKIDPLFPRPVRLQPPKVRMGFIPDDWFQSFYQKTGVTGPYVFLVTFSTFVISKEIYVMDHDYYWGLSMLLSVYLSSKYLGPPLAEYLDKEIDSYEASWNNARNNEKQALESQVEDEIKLQRCIEGQLLLLAAKRENVGLQYEEAYRKRLIAVNEAVLKRLNFHVRTTHIYKRFLQKNAVEWIIKQVEESYTSEHAKENIDACILHLKQLATKKTS